MANYGQISIFKVSMETVLKKMQQSIILEVLKLTLANIGHIVLLSKGRKLL